jgi:hypothetical protein
LWIEAQGRCVLARPVVAKMKFGINRRGCQGGLSQFKKPIGDSGAVKVREIPQILNAEQG